MTVETIRLRLGIKLLEAGLNPNNLKLEKYRDPKDFADVVRGYFKFSDNLSEAILFERKYRDDENLDEDRIVNVFYTVIFYRLFPKQPEWMLEFYKSFERKI